MLLELASAENQIDYPMVGIESVLVFQEDLLCKHLEPLYEYPNQGLFRRGMQKHPPIDSTKLFVTFFER